MKKITAAGFLFLLSIAKLALDTWDVLDGLIAKLRSKGSAGNFMADVLVSRITVLILVLVGLGLLWVAIKELRAVRSKSSQGSDDDRGKGERRSAALAEGAGDALPLGRPLVEIHNSNSQTHQQSQTQPQQQSAPSPSVDPLPVKIREVFITPTGEVTDERESWGELNPKTLAAIAELYRGADGSPEGFVDVRAHVVFLDANDKPLYRINDGIWWKFDCNHRSFEPGDSWKLAIAIVDHGMVLPYEGNWRPVEATYETDEKFFELNSNAKPLEGNNFHVVIEMIGTRGRMQTFSGRADYDLIAEPPSFTLRTRANVSHRVEEQTAVN